MIIFGQTLSNRAVLLDPIFDHLPIFFNLCTKENSDKTVYDYRCFSEKAQQKFNKSLRKMLVHDILDKKDINVAYNLFIDRYMSLFKSCVSIKKRKQIIKVRPWFTDELKELNDEKQRNYLFPINNERNTHLKLNYNKSRNAYFGKAKAVKREYYQKHLNAVRNDVKGTWKVINSVLGRSSTKDTFKLSVDGKEITDKSQIARELIKQISRMTNLVSTPNFVVLRNLIS